MALSREQADKPAKLFCSDFYERCHWYREHKRGRFSNKWNKNQMNRYLRRLPLSDTPTGKSGRKPMRGYTL